jgi:heme O synthase-like polyprenyltransferase
MALANRQVLPIIITAFLGITLSLAGSYAIFHWTNRAADLEVPSGTW